MCIRDSSRADQASKVFCVVQESNNINDDACQPYNPTECHPLVYYMNYSSKYFKSYETYVFQHGQHTPLDRFTLKIINVTNLTLTGSDTAKSSVIDCNGRSTAFLFGLSSNITIKNLTFTTCIQQHKSNRKINDGLSTLSFHGGSNLSLLGVTVLMSVDEAFFIEDVFGEIVINNLKVANSTTAGKLVPFVGNKITYHNCNGNHKTSKLFITNSSFINNSNFFTGKHKHIELFAGGLLISLGCPNIEVKIDNLTMLNNTGGTGGNVALFFYSTQTYFNISVEICNSNFEGGYAAEGGDMYAEFAERSLEKIMHEANPQPHKLFKHNTHFTANVVQYAGSGVYLKQKLSLSSHFMEEITFANVTFNNNFVINTGLGSIAIH